MIGCFKFLAGLFAVLALVAIGHDVWRAWSIGNEFTLSSVGGLFMHYAPAEHDAAREAIANTTSVKTFNTFFVPILSLPTVALTGGLAAFFTGLMFLVMRIKNGPRAKKGTSYRHRPNY